jgi:hypothetical protein
MLVQQELGMRMLANTFPRRAASGRHPGPAARALVDKKRQADAACSGTPLRKAARRGGVSTSSQPSTSDETDNEQNDEDERETPV